MTKGIEASSSPFMPTTAAWTRGASLPRKTPLALPTVEPWHVENAHDCPKIGITSFANDTTGVAASNPGGGA